MIGRIFLKAVFSHTFATFQFIILKMSMKLGFHLTLRQVLWINIESSKKMEKKEALTLALGHITCTID